MFSCPLRLCCGVILLGLAGFELGCAKPPVRVEAPPPRVTVQHPEVREIVDHSEYNGWTDASKTVEIRSRVRGHIDKIHFTDGQIVDAGQLLFELDPRPFQAEVQAAEGQVEVTKAQQEFSVADEERQQELFDKKVNTKADLQKAIATRKSWDANIVVATQALQGKQLDLTYSKILSPIKGKISRALLDAGNLVNAGGSDPLLTTVVSIDPLFVYFFIDERALLEYRQKDATRKSRTHAQSLKESQIPFEFGLETDRGFPHKGTLDFAENRIDPKTGTIEVRGVVSNADATFLPGSRVRVRVPISDPYQALLVPDTAILSDQDQRYLLCLNDDNVVVRRNVNLGRLLSDGMRVLLPGDSKDSDVTATDWVITNGLQRARLNYPVEPMDTEGKPIAREPAAQ